MRGLYRYIKIEGTIVKHILNFVKFFRELYIFLLFKIMKPPAFPLNLNLPAFEGINGKSFIAFSFSEYHYY